MALSAESNLPEELQSEIETLEVMFNDNEIIINQKQNFMVIDYLKTIDEPQSITLKVTFAFTINDITSSLLISVKNTSKSRRKHLPKECLDALAAALKERFESEIENMPIYQCIEYLNNEWNAPKIEVKEPSNSNTESVQSENKQSQPETEWIAFIRFNHLFHGKQHKKESEMLSELKSLRKCSTHFFGRYFYGKPGVICICSTERIITSFARKCNEIGKKAVISMIMPLDDDIDLDSVQIIKSGSNEKLDTNSLRAFLSQNLGLKQIENVISEILTGNDAEFKVNGTKTMNVSQSKTGEKINGKKKRKRGKK